MTLRERKLGDYFKVKHGYAFKSEYFTDAGNHVVVTPGNFYDEGGFKKKGDKEKFYNGPIPPDFLLRKGDLIVAMTEQAEGLLGSSALIPENNYYLHNQRLGLVTQLDETQLDKRFLYYLFNTREVRNQIRATATGAKIRHTAPERILSVSFKYLPIEAQRRIAVILSAYDDLIENNTRRIQLLEEMARRIYEEWFVRFRFPGHENVPLVASELGPVPQGWLEPFSTHIDFLEGPGLRNWQYRNEGIPFLNIRTLIPNDIDKSKLQFLDVGEVESKYRHFLLKAYDHVVSSSGTLGRIVTIQERHLPLMLNTSIIRMRPKSERMGCWLLKHFLVAAYFQNQINAFASGSAQKNYGPMHLKQMWIISPTKEIKEQFEQLITPLEEQILNLSKRNNNLRTTRDLLLPKLISGAIDVADLDIGADE
jgi:type I restriction enzyme S subunit